MTKDEAKQKTAELVKKYEALSPSAARAFNEANTKQGFILPLFGALGWDVNETKEVTMEEAASGGRVDFAFKLNGVAQFYLEAKKFNADLNNPEHMKQAVTYAYGNGVTWAVLTNFEELRLLNAQRSTPFITLIYDDYVKEFDKLWLLSRESLANGLLTKEATQYGALTKLVPIEERLFKQLRVWREELYNQLFHHDEWLKPEQRDEIIEKLFNRLIFIRTCEDRKLEEHQLLSAFRQWQRGGNKKDELLPTLRKIFDYYRGYYDSDLFATDLVDDARVFVYDETIANILTGLYDIPGGMASYDFSIIDADMLGRVYEQYLGYVSKVVVAKAKQAQAKLAMGFAIDTDYELLEKKQQRKEQGIYYTPKFVTNYIVKETVGRFIRENEHDGYNKILNMKILDPACGSGSFLIRAYDELLNYHAKVRGKTASELGQNDRLPILTRNVFGVDLDERAVEIARLNLLLRSLANRDLLPPLTDNIKRGNSLISGTAEELKGHFGKNWKSKHPFNWDEQFKDIMTQGGFDVVIGNPPYVSVTALETVDREYFMSHFETALKRFDVYVGFIERGLKLLKDKGLFGFIIPYPFLSQDYTENLRGFILEHCRIEEIVDFSGFKVFTEAVVRNVILILRKEEDEKVRRTHYVQVLTPENSLAFQEHDGQAKAIQQAIFVKIPQKMYRLDLDSNVEMVISKVDNCSIGLGTIVVASWGARGVPIKNFHLDEAINEYCKPMIKGENIRRYSLNWTGKWLLYDTDKLYRPAFPEIFQSEKIVISKVTGEEGIISTYDDGKYFTDDSLCCCILKYHLASKKPSFFGRRKIKISPEEIELSRKYSLKYILALINSKLLNFYFEKLLSYELNVYPESIEQFPIRRIDFANPIEKKLHNKLVVLVENMLKLNKRLAPICDTYSNERDELESEINKTDREIDNLVYDLYGLTEEERKVVKTTV